MKKILIIFCIATISLASCVRFNTIRPSGRVTTENRSVDEFTKVAVSGGIDLVVYNGAHEVLVEAHENLHDYIEVYVKAGCLIVRPRPHVSFGHRAHATVYVSADYIHSVDASGGSNVNIPNGIVADNLILEGSGGAEFDGIVSANYLKVALSGGGEADLNIDCDKIDVKTSGGSELDIIGEAGIMYLSISGGGSLEGFDFHVNELYANMSGGATAVISVSDYLSADLSGGSRLEYRGLPVVEAQTSGGSRVVQIH